MGLGISIGGPKDGAGKSTFALHLAYGLSKFGGKSVCLVDADIANLGDLAVLLNAKNNRSLVDYIKQSGRMDAKLTQSWVTRCSLGFYLLDSASFATDFQTIEDQAIDKALKLLLRSFDYCLFDLGRDFHPLSFRTLENSSLAFIVATSDLIGIHQAAEYSKKLRSLQFGSDFQRLILNRYDAKNIISPQMVKQKMGLDTFAMLPDDPAAFQQVISQGKPLQVLNPRHSYLKCIDDVMKAIQQVESRGEKSRVGRSSAASAWEALKPVIPFFGGGAASSGGRILEHGTLPNAQIERNLSIRARVHERLLELVDLKQMDAFQLEKDPKKKEELKGKTAQAIQRLLEEEAREIENRQERSELAKDILDEAIGLGPMEPLLANAEVSEIMVNGKDQIYVERKGRLTLTDYHYTTEKQLTAAIERIVSPISRRVDEKTPLCDARLKDGSRINIIIPPLSLRGPVITVRKFFKERLTINDLIKYGSLTEEMSDFLRAAVGARLNIVVSGGTGTGKTTLLNMVAGFIPEDERIVTVEDAAELQLPQPHVITLESRPANLQGDGAIHIRDLVRNSLRMRPDRIVVGECRAGEALDMLQAMNTGHDGSLTTIHSNNPRDCIRRIETLVMMAGFDLPMQAIREQIAAAIHLIVQLKRYSDGTRRISHITEVIGIEGETVVTQPIFEFKQSGVDDKGKVKGQFQPSGLIPKFVETLKAKGIAPPKGLFAAGPKSMADERTPVPSTSSSGGPSASGGSPAAPSGVGGAPGRSPLPASAPRTPAAPASTPGAAPRKPLTVPLRNPSGVKKP